LVQLKELDEVGDGVWRTDVLKLAARVQVAVLDGLMLCDKVFEMLLLGVREVEDFPSALELSLRLPEVLLVRLRLPLLSLVLVLLHVAVNVSEKVTLGDVVPLGDSEGLPEVVLEADCELDHVFVVCELLGVNVPLPLNVSVGVTERLPDLLPVQATVPLAVCDPLDDEVSVFVDTVVVPLGVREEQKENDSERVVVLVFVFENTVLQLREDDCVQPKLTLGDKLWVAVLVVEQDRDTVPVKLGVKLIDTEPDREFVCLAELLTDEVPDHEGVQDLLLRECDLVDVSLLLSEHVKELLVVLVYDWEGLMEPLLVELVVMLGTNVTVGVVEELAVAVRLRDGRAVQDSDLLPLMLPEGVTDNPRLALRVLETLHERLSLRVALRLFTRLLVTVANIVHEGEIDQEGVEVLEQVHDIVPVSVLLERLRLDVRELV